jgi:PhoPQ-activated pathogenicity-related protein
MKKFLVALAMVGLVRFGAAQALQAEQVDRHLGTLQAYVQDTSGFSYQLFDSVAMPGALVYRVKMISGTWLDPAVVDQPEWWHWLDIVVPEQRDRATALLFIGGGSTHDTIWEIDSLNVAKAIQTRSVVAHISNIPFQPLTMIQSDTIARYEDDLIAYGWDQFLSRGAREEDAGWLARFPMTRAVVRGMDVIQELTGKTEVPVSQFFVSGASKRGWTTWTTAAADDRVFGMAPLVIDLLNLEESFNHHYRVYGAWSPAVSEYEQFQIMDWIGSSEFEALMDYVEPYQFREVFDMPKLIVNGTIDEFFATDSWQFYYDDLPGEKYLQYVPNGNHGLAGSYNTPNVFSFYDHLIHGWAMPSFDWEVTPEGFEVRVDPAAPVELSLWQITNPKARDFRIWEVGQNWEKTILAPNESGIYVIEAPQGEGYTASLIEATFNPGTDRELIFTTGTLVRPDQYPFPDFKSASPKGSMDR